MVRDQGGGDPPQRPPRLPGREREGGVAEKTRERVARPPRFKVVLYNDDYTQMDFVVAVLERVFGIEHGAEDPIAR